MMMSGGLLRWVIPHGTARVWERNVLALRGFWLVVVSGFVEPLFYLLSLGFGLGHLIPEVTFTTATGEPAVASYASFVAPALLASAAMNGAIYEASHNVFWKLRYSKIYRAMLATPVGVGDIARAEALWALARSAGYSAVFVCMAWALGVIPAAGVLPTLGAALLTGVAFAGVGIAIATVMRTWQDFDMLQLAVLPMFLFSTTFFPADVLPGAWRWLLNLSPLYHAVALCRNAALGLWSSADLLHAGVLLGLGTVGVVVAAVRMRRALLD